MGGKATGSQGSIATTAPNQSFGNAYADLWRRAQGVADTPYESYGGQRVAERNQLQDFGSGILTGRMDEVYWPMFHEATGMFRDASRFDPSQVQALQSPYTQQVIDATQNQFNEQNQRQQQGIIGNAASAGAWGGDRSAVAQGIVAGQQQLAQAPVIAGLYDRSYAQALDQYNKNRANVAAQGTNIAGLANMGASYNQAQAAAAMGAGNQIQAQRQAELNVPYQDFLERRAYPFQTTGWLANLGTGLGGAAGSSRTTSNSYSPAPLSTAAGLLSTGAGILGQTGAFGQNGWLSNGLSNWWGGSGGISGITGGDVDWFSQASLDDPLAGGAILSARGGRIPQRRHGGRLGIHANDNRRYTPARATGTFGRGIRGYADGGDVWEDDEDYDTGLGEPYTFDDAAALATPDYRGTGIAAGAAPGGMGPGISSRYAVDLPIPERTDRSAGIRANAPWLALTRAGLGILGAGTLNAWTDIGRGGEEGLKTYQRETERADAIDDKEAAAIGAAQRQAASLKQQGVRLEDAAREAAARLEQGDRRLGQERELRLGDQQIRREEAQRRAKVEAARLALEGRRLEQGKMVPLGFGEEPGEDGKPVKGVYVLDTSSKQAVFIPNVTAGMRSGFGGAGAGDPKTLDGVRARAVQEFEQAQKAADGDPAKLEAAKAAYEQKLDTIRLAAEARAPGKQPSPQEQAFAAWLKANPGATPEQMQEQAQKGRVAPRSAVAMVAAKILEENPGISATELNQRVGDFRAINNAISRFTVGPEANVVRSFSVMSEHLGTLETLGNALKNNDLQVANRLFNWIGEQTGAPAPTNFKAAKDILGAEIIKGIVGAGGGVTDREEARKALDRAQSPAQLAGALDTIRELIQGQMKGLEAQYTRGTRRNDFRDLLSPDAQKIMDYKHKGAPRPEATAPAAGGGTPSRPAGVPDGARYSPSKGEWWWQEGGEWRKASGASAPAPATAPAPIARDANRPGTVQVPIGGPPGSRAIGRTPDGRTVYQDAEGNRFTLN